MDHVPRLTLFALAVAVGITSTSSAAVPRDQFIQHITRVKQFKCSVPQPRAVMALDLLHENGFKLTSEYIIPAMTVVNRCDSGSGCCWEGDHTACTPVGKEEVKLEFKLVDPRSGKDRNVVVKAINHTKCACKQKVFSTPKPADEDTTVTV